MNSPGQTRRLLLLLGAASAGALAVYIFAMRGPAATSGDGDAIAVADPGPPEQSFGNLRWTYEGPTPLPVPTIGWNETALRALIVRHGQAHVVVRAPVDGEAAYLLRPITTTWIGEAVTTRVGVFDRVRPGVPMLWVLSDGRTSPDSPSER